MRSAETSGVDEGGFGEIDAASSPAERIAAFFASISLGTYMVGLCTLLAATGFVAVDWAHTYDQLDRRAALMRQFTTAQPVAGRLIATALQPMVGAQAAEASRTRLVQRAALAYALAALVTGFAFRRRHPSGFDRLARFSDLMATIPFGVACWNAEGRLLTCNAQYGLRLGAEAELRRGTSYPRSIRRLIRGGYVQLISEDDDSRVLELHREDGSCLLIDERPLATGGFVTFVTDVTASRRADHLITSIREEQRVLARRYHEEKLRAEAASRSKTSFLAHLSHDIRTPLNHIIGFAEMMQHETYGPLGDRRYAGYVETIRNSGERLLSFFASILDLAELEGGSRTLRAEPVPVDDMLRGVTRRFSSQAQQARLTLALGAPCGATLVGDRFSLERMLDNVVENAIRFTPAGGRVSLAAHAAADGVVLEITDTGIGMDEERLALVSQPFAFGDAALTRERQGAGLGLAIARTIAELSGGRLAIDSRPGLGTTVAVSLPLPASDAIDAAA